MQNFVAIMAQLFWGVTVGALGSAFSTLATAALTVAGLSTLGWCGLKWRRRRKGRPAESSGDST